MEVIHTSLSLIPQGHPHFPLYQETHVHAVFFPPFSENGIDPQNNQEITLGRNQKGKKRDSSKRKKKVCL